MSTPFPDYNTREGRASVAATKVGRPLLMLGFSHAKWECIGNFNRGFGETPKEAYADWQSWVSEFKKAYR